MKRYLNLLILLSIFVAVLVFLSQTKNDSPREVIVALLAIAFYIFGFVLLMRLWKVLGLLTSVLETFLARQNRENSPERERNNPDK